jgi:hypothetical protein
MEKNMVGRREKGNGGESGLGKENGSRRVGSAVENRPKGTTGL